MYPFVIMDEVIKNYHDFTIQAEKYKEKFEGHLKDNPIALKLAVKYAEFIYSANDPRNKTNVKKIKDIIYHLDRTKIYSHLELTIIPYIILQFTLEEIKKLTRNLLDMYSQAIPESTASAILGSLCAIVKYYTNNGYYNEADKIYNEIKKLHTYNRGLLATSLMVLECLYIFNLVAWGKSEAAPLYKNMINYLESAKFIDEQYYSIMLENFITKCRALNKSNIPL
ncbi:hypothetical protein [Streptococcus suis]|uniref:Transcriptional regulator n=1 Tax=Streptococcus suis TaxID=1307 RepID=A0A116KX43_STRSU|nr:hypothetical protein [Streptococcus suis]CYU60732.1 transcriptional regulator [Streptococcus suis]